MSVEIPLIQCLRRQYPGPWLLRISREGYNSLTTGTPHLGTAREFYKVERHFLQFGFWILVLKSYLAMKCTPFISQYLDINSLQRLFDLSWFQLWELLFNQTISPGWKLTVRVNCLYQGHNTTIWNPNRVPNSLSLVQTEDNNDLQYTAKSLFQRYRICSKLRYTLYF